MKGKRFLCMLLASLLTMGMLPANADVSVVSLYDLRVNDLENPIGLDDAPTFSWKMDDDTVGAAQSAYRIMVADNKEFNSPVWDSGKTESNLSTGISYAGEALQPATVYYWQVTVWNRDGQEICSPIASFETGLMDSSLWGEEIQWISVTEEPLVHYTVEADLTVTEVVSYDSRAGVALVFGATDENNLYMIHFRINGDAIECRPHVYGIKSGAAAPSWATLSTTDLVSKLGWTKDEFVGKTFHVKLDVTDQQIVTYVDGTQVNVCAVADYVPVNSIGKVGTRAQTYEKGKLDNIVVKNVLQNDEVVCAYDFEDGVNPFGVGTVEDGCFLADYSVNSIALDTLTNTVTTVKYTVEADMNGTSGDVNLLFGRNDNSHFYMAHFNISGNTLQFKPHVQSSGWSSTTIDLTAAYGITVDYYKNNPLHLEINVTNTKIVYNINGTKVYETAPHADVPITAVGQLGVRWYSGTGYIDNLVLTDYSRYSEGLVICAYDFDDGINPFGVGSILDGKYVPGGTKSAVVFDPNTYVFTKEIKGTASFRKDVEVKENILSARLYSTALGTYDAFINGKRVGRLLADGSTQYDELKPTFTDAQKRKLYYTYDVTHLLKAGQTNTLAAWVTDGYWSGNIVLASKRGNEKAFAARLVIDYADGSQEVISTDTTWQGAFVGPMVYGDIYNGETYDATQGTDWMLPGFTGWHETSKNVEFTGTVAAHSGTTTIVREELSPVEMYVYNTVEGATDLNSGRIIKDRTYRDGDTVTLHKGETLVVDLGQNHAGWESFTVTGAAGTKLRIRHGEILNVNEGAIGSIIDGPVGSVFVNNLRTALATTNYILSGDGKESYHPTMTYYGYRYLEFVASDTVTFDTIRSQVITNVQRDSGNIVTSNQKLNQLISNTRWGQYSNFVGVPTDCPQRDERAGWLADTWVFAATGQYYSADTKAFLEKWMDDVVDCQTADGRYQSGSPAGGGYGTPLGRTGWADAALIVPYNMYLMTGDCSMIEEHYDSMQLYVDGYLATTDKKGADGWYGDWLAPGDNNDDTVKEMLGVIFYAWDAQLMAEMARILGKTEDVAHYEALFETEKQYFIDTYVNADGSLVSNRQTPALYALYLDLLPDENSRALVKQELLANIEENSYMLSTGFMGTPILLEVLTEEGAQEIAYKILMQEGNPSWLYAVNAGATTVWEKWAACAENGAFLGGSLNHYAYGSVVEWMYRYMAGINYDEDTPGFKKILLAPHPDQMIESVSATYDSPYGEIKSAWSYDGGTFTYNAVLPANTTAQIRMPVEKMDTLQVNGKAYTALTAADDGILFTALEEDVAVFEAVAGSYAFTTAVEEKCYLSLSVQGNDGIPTYVAVNGEELLLPTRLEVEPGQSVELSAFCANSVDYPVVAWQDADGNTLSQKKTYAFTVENGNTDLTVVLGALGAENIAEGAAVTANCVNNTWHYSYLTDGNRTHLEGTNGWSSPYQGQNVAFAAPVEAVLDLGERKTFNRLHLYPRTDQTASKTTPMNFPTTYTVYISDDNATWTPLVQVTDGEAATWRPAVHILETEAQAQYIKLSVTAVNHADGSGNCYVQLAEFGVYNFNCEHSSTTLIVDQKPTISTDGRGHTECDRCGQTVQENVVIPKPTGEAYIGDMVYETLAEALAAVKSGETVTLYADVTVSNLAVNPNVTLDLNGRTLTAEYVVAFNDSVVIDSAEDGSGKIIVPANRMILSKNNPQLPVYDEENGCFLFTRVKNDRFELTTEGDSPQYSTSPMFKEYVHSALNTTEKVSDSGVEVIIRLTWTDSEGQYAGTQDYTYFDDSIAEVMASYVNENGTVNYEKQFYGIFVGSEIESGVNVSVSTVVKSSTGVEMESAKTALFTAQ